MGRILLDTPVPGLGPGLGSMPRGHSELGQFFGLTGTIDSRRIDKGFSGSDNQGSGWIGGLDVGFRVGLGLEGVLGNAGDGLVFAQLGLRSETPSSNRQTLDGSGLSSLGPGSTMPARSGLSTRFRMPFYLLPGDLLLMSPMYFFNRPAYENMAVTAANGGVIPWQYGIATGIGRFQLVVGRELGVTWYGTVFGDSHMADASTGRQRRPAAGHAPVDIFRRAAGGISSVSLVYEQPEFDRAVPAVRGYRRSLTVSTRPRRRAPAVNLDTIYSLGVRLLFDWRYYP